MDKSLLSSTSHIVISLTDKRDKDKDKEIVNVIRSDIDEEKIDPVAENAEYENYKLTPECQKHLKNTFHYFSSETCHAFGKILDIINSREVNAQLLPPEFVLIGPTGHGKSSILEALLGRFVHLNSALLSFSVSHYIFQ
jgi:GTPase Era involved in 16S rRNA processing